MFICALMEFLVSVFCLGFFLNVEGFILHTFNTTNVKPLEYSLRNSNVGQPLLVTPYLEEKDIFKAQNLSKVIPDIIEGVPSFSGYLTVNKNCGSNLFFWFFPAQQKWEEAPLVLWLQGGPGVSSLYGLFVELGPIMVTKKRVEKRKFSWNVRNNLLFIDQPVGTGFSFTEKGCYAKSEDDVSKDLYNALTQFYQLFPIIKDNKFYVTGESFAGHYIPALGHAIHKNNNNAETKINLSGMMIGNGLMDIKYQNDYASYLYQLGFIDDLKRDEYYQLQKLLIKQLNKEEWKQAFISWVGIDKTMGRYVSAFDFTEKYKGIMEEALEPWMKFINRENIRKAIHVGGKKFFLINNDVYTILENDMMMSVKPMVEELLEHYPIVFYNGQLDIICSYPMAVNFFRNLQWTGAQKYLSATRQEWSVDETLAGFFKSAGNLHELLIRDAGHMVPKDQPLWAFCLLDSVTNSPLEDPLQQLQVCTNLTLF